MSMFGLFCFRISSFCHSLFKVTFVKKTIRALKKYPERKIRYLSFCKLELYLFEGVSNNLKKKYERIIYEREIIIHIECYNYSQYSLNNLCKIIKGNM